MKNKMLVLLLLLACGACTVAALQRVSAGQPIIVHLKDVGGTCTVDETPHGWGYRSYPVRWKVIATGKACENKRVEIEMHDMPRCDQDDVTLANPFAACAANNTGDLSKEKYLLCLVDPAAGEDCYKYSIGGDVHQDPEIEIERPPLLFKYLWRELLSRLRG